MTQSYFASVIIMGVVVVWLMMPMLTLLCCVHDTSHMTRPPGRPGNEASIGPDTSTGTQRRLAIHCTCTCTCTRTCICTCTCTCL